MKVISRLAEKILMWGLAVGVIVLNMIMFERAPFSKPSDFKATFGIDFSRRSRW